MNKFDRFLDDDPRPTTKPQSRSLARQVTGVLDDNVSVKIKSETLHLLKILKNLESHRSYAAVIDHLLDEYVTTRPDLAETFALLKA